MSVKKPIKSISVANAIQVGMANAPVGRIELEPKVLRRAVHHALERQAYCAPGLGGHRETAESPNGNV